MAKRLHLGQGQVASPDAEVWEARRVFLRDVYAVEPDVYTSLFPDGYGQDAYDAWRRRWNDDLPAMIAAWQKYWHLIEQVSTDSWLADVALNTLRARLRWHIQGVTMIWNADVFVTAKPSTMGSGHLSGIPLYELFWNRADETRADVRKRLLAAIDAELDRVEGEASLPPVKQKTPEHFKWLARRQVGDESTPKLAAALGRDRASLGRELNALADFIGLKPRTYRRGRPRRNTSRTKKTVRFR